MVEGSNFSTRKRWRPTTSPSASVSLTINGPAPTVLAFFLNATIDQRVERHLAESGELERAREKFEAELVKKGRIAPNQIDEALISQHLFTAGQPDPDLLIRPSGELRVSNFLLWQIAYAEIYVTDVAWPDFREPELDRALASFGHRERRFGRTGNQLAGGEQGTSA